MAQRVFSWIPICLFLLVSVVACPAERAAAACPDLIDAHAGDGNTAYVGGNLGALIKTTDRGKTWSVLDSGLKAIITDVYFLKDGDTGFVAGVDGELLRTVDGGQTWTPLDRESSAMINDVFFPSAASGFAVGDTGTVLKSTDGGISWKPLDAGTQYFLMSVAFYDDRNGFVGGEQGVLLRTGDGGNTWQDISLPEQGNIMNIIVGPGQEQGLAILGSGMIYYTANAGETWQKAETPADIFLSSAWLAPDGRSGFAAGAMGLILETADGGATWTPSPMEFDQDIYSTVLAPDGRTGYAAGTNGFLAIYEAENGWHTSDLTQVNGLDCSAPETVQHSANPDCNPDSRAFQTKNALQAPDGIVLLEDTGDTPETAIIICFASDHATGVKSEYGYLGYVLGPEAKDYKYTQSLVSDDNGVFDMFEFNMPDGSIRKFYFEISDFFSKY